MTDDYGRDVIAAATVPKLPINILDKVFSLRTNRRLLCADEFLSVHK